MPREDILLVYVPICVTMYYHRCVTMYCHHCVTMCYHRQMSHFVSMMSYPSDTTMSYCVLSMLSCPSDTTMNYCVSCCYYLYCPLCY